MMNLTQQDKDAVYAIMQRLNGLKEDNPEELSYALSTSLDDSVDVSSLTPIQVSALFFNALDTNPDVLEEEVVAAIPSLPAPLSFHTSDMSALFAGRSANGDGGFGSCECDYYTYYPSSPCYDECFGYSGTGVDCLDPYASNYGELGDCTYAGDDDGYSFGDFFGDAWGVVQEIGLDNIFSWITGGSDDADNPNPSTPSSGGGENGGGDDDEETDWGKIALIAGGVLVVGVGLYFAFKRRK